METDIITTDLGLPEHLQQLTDALGLLIERAIRVTPRFGAVDVRVDTLRSGALVFAIDDDGPYIYPEALDAMHTCMDQEYTSSFRIEDRLTEMLCQANLFAAACNAKVNLQSHKQHGSCATIVVPLP